MPLLFAISLRLVPGMWAFSLKGPQSGNTHFLEEPNQG